MDIGTCIYEAMNRLPKLEGPIPVTVDSYPFCDMLHSREPLNVKDYGYIEEEFFLSGLANVYDEDEHGKVFVKYANLPYKNRVLVRRPENINSFSGRVYIDILNATANYDIEDLWHRSYLWCMENGHGYIGITSKPVCVQSLKNFDYLRYESLNWSGPVHTAQPVPLINGSIPGTEEGLFWDMLGQAASLIKYGNEFNCFEGATVNYLCLTGQSQSGIYLNTFFNSFHKYISSPKHDKLFDGYLNIVGVPYQRDLCQKADNKKFSYKARRQCEIDIPCIFISSEGDLTLFSSKGVKDAFRLTPDNSYTQANKSRYYEVAASPHTDINCPVLSAEGEIKKAGRVVVAPINKERLETLNDMPLAYYINGFLEKLYTWAEKGIPPEVVEPIKKNNKGEIVRDIHSNAECGFRSPFVDVPLAGYYGYSRISEDGISGDMARFSKDKFLSLYKNPETYLKKFADYTNRQVNDGWLCKSDAKRMILWSKISVKKYM